MKHLHFLLLLQCRISSKSANPMIENEYSQTRNMETMQPAEHDTFDDLNSIPNHSIRLNIASIREESLKSDESGNTSPNTHQRPAVLEGGLLSAQVARHTLIAIDRFLKILKSFAGFAIITAISMPIINEITSSLLETLIGYL